MRKIKLQMQSSIDGFVGKHTGEMDWMEWNWGEDIKNYVIALTDSIDTIILGRKLAEGFIPYWENVASNPNDKDYEFGKKLNDALKVVFSKTLEKSLWNNTILANGEISEEINELKSQDGKDIIVYGGAAFVSSLIKVGLIDEFHLFINPTAIGSGLSIFNKIEKYQKLKLVKSISFDCGIVLINYELKNE